MKFNPWRSAKLTKQNKSGSQKHYETSEGSVDVFDPRKSDGTDIPNWALYQEAEEIQAQHPDWTHGEILDGARQLFLKRREP